MRLLRQGFVWQFAGGFALGTVALLTLQPSEGRHALASHFVSGISHS